MEGNGPRAGYTSRHKGTQCILFRSGGVEYLIRSSQIVEIEMVERVTPIPNSPHFVLGVTNIRGDVIPVMDLRLRLGQTATELGISSRIIVVSHKRRRVGIVVDSAREVYYLERESLMPSPETATAGKPSNIEGVVVSGDRLLLLLDLERILSAEADIVSPIDDTPEGPGRLKPDTGQNDEADGGRQDAAQGG